MISRFLSDWPWKLLSLCAAVLIWMAVASEPEMATVLRVPVQYQHAAADLEISSDIESTVRLELLGVTGRLKEFSGSPTPVVLDFASVRAPGVRTFNIDRSTVRLPKGVQLVRAIPAQLRFVFEKQEKRTVPVLVQWSGQLPPGVHMGLVTTDPAALTVVGPESRVRVVRSVVTDPVNLATLRNGGMVTTSPFIADPQVRFQNFRPVEVRVILKN